MKPTEELVHEHQVIVHVLKTATAEAQSIRDGSAIRTALVGMMPDFFSNFTDKCHHAKEEKHLFPLIFIPILPLPPQSFLWLFP